MVSLVFGAVVSALGDWWGPAFAGWEIAAQVVNVLVGFGLTTVVFAMIYKLMPRVHVQWHDVWLGAIVTSLLFTVGKFLIGLYIGKSGIASGFGAAGSLIVIFVWVYYSAQIFLVGAEFTWIYARTLGSMRGLADPRKSSAREGDREAPTARSEVFPEVADAPAATPPAAVVPATPVRAPASDDPRDVLRDVGAGLAWYVALRFIVPRLLRRL